MFITIFIIKAILTGIIGSSFYVWFKKTSMGVWFNKKLDKVMTKVVNRCDVEALKKEEKKLKKIPESILTNVNLVSTRLEEVEKRLKKLEEERNLEKELWHKIKANPPRK